MYGSNYVILCPLFYFIFLYLQLFSTSRKTHKSVLLYIIFIFIIKSTWMRRDGIILLIISYTSGNDEIRDFTVLLTAAKIWVLCFSFSFTFFSTFSEFVISAADKKHFDLSGMRESEFGWIKYRWKKNKCESWARLVNHNAYIFNGISWYTTVYQ